MSIRGDLKKIKDGLRYWSKFSTFSDYVFVRSKYGSCELIPIYRGYHFVKCDLHFSCCECRFLKVNSGVMIMNLYGKVGNEYYLKVPSYFDLMNLLDETEWEINRCKRVILETFDESFDASWYGHRSPESVRRPYEREMNFYEQIREIIARQLVLDAFYRLLNFIQGEGFED